MGRGSIGSKLSRSLWEITNVTCDTTGKKVLTENRQQDGPLAVADMCNALALSSIAKTNEPLTIERICALAYYVKPSTNGNFRTVPVTFKGLVGGVEPEPEPEHIARQLMLLCEYASDHRLSFTPEEFYQMFEEIHPFTDGNGRVGAILYNYLQRDAGTPYHSTRV